jgi:transcriptional regulator with XRE-family HTH domain
MNRINPTALTHHRGNMSMDELSRRSGVDKSSIFSTEKGKRKRNNLATIEALAKALKVEPEALTATEFEPAKPENAFFAKTKLTMQISAESRNALLLVAMRYNVTPTDIVEFAPLLFHLAACESLNQRDERLAELRAARDAVGDLSAHFRFIDARLTSDPSAEHLELLEEKSIRKRDLRSKKFDEDASLMETRPYDYDDDEDNPFITHLRDRLASIVGDGSAEWSAEGSTESPANAPAESVEAWSEYFGPRYAICIDEARAYLGGDEEAADDFIHGRFSVSDIPKEMRSLDKARERLAWANAQRQERAATADELFSILGLGDLS